MTDVLGVWEVRKKSIIPVAPIMLSYLIASLGSVYSLNGNHAEKLEWDWTIRAVSLTPV